MRSTNFASQWVRVEITPKKERQRKKRWEKKGKLLMKTCTRISWQITQRPWKICLKIAKTSMQTKQGVERHWSKNRMFLKKEFCVEGDQIISCISQTSTKPLTNAILEYLRQSLSVRAKVSWTRIRLRLKWEKESKKKLKLKKRRKDKNRLKEESES